MKISVPIAWYKEPAPIVEGEIIDVPHLAFVATFIVHRGAPGDWQDWKVSNVETGASVSWGRTRAEAIKYARKKLDKNDEKSLLQTYRKFNKWWPQYRRRNGAV